MAGWEGGGWATRGTKLLALGHDPARSVCSKITGGSWHGGMICACVQGLRREEPGRWECLSSVATVFVHLTRSGNMCEVAHPPLW